VRGSKAVAVLVILASSACTSESVDSAPRGDSAVIEDTGPADDGFEDLAGRVYVQTGEPIGWVSYTFAAEDDIYIDYSAYPAEITLDDGSPVPDHKAFIDIAYEGARTFTGTIDWAAEGTTYFGGDALRVYEMIFAPDYTSIESGRVDSFLSDGTHRLTWFYAEDWFYVLAD
jgi:hypothetical protein